MLKNTKIFLIFVIILIVALGVNSNESYKEHCKPECLKPDECKTCVDDCNKRGGGPKMTKEKCAKRCRKKHCKDEEKKEECASTVLNCCISAGNAVLDDDK